MELRNWHIDRTPKGILLGHGIVYGNEKFVDGTKIHTSVVQSVRRSTDELIELHTKNSVYECKISSCCAWKQQQLDILPFDVATAAAQHYKAVTLADRGIVLDLDVDADYCVQEIAVCSKNTKQKLRWYVNLGMTHDSVIIGDDARETDIRFTINENDTIDFYCIDTPDNIPVYIHNVGSKPVTYITGTLEVVTVPPKETIEI